jgi:uncharacterized protein YjbI with pentapeptide repeats
MSSVELWPLLEKREALMSEQDGTQASTKQRRIRQISKQNGKQATKLIRPTNDNKEAWIAYWKQQGQPWRTEPEIDEKRQKYLEERRGIVPDTKQGIYPFKAIKLCRADVEWLLATHESGVGPINWSDESQRERMGLDLRGADLRKVDLHALPLACIQGGQEIQWVIHGTEEQGNIVAILHAEADLSTEEQGNIVAAVLMEEANLHGAQLQNAQLHRAQLQEANLYEAQLQEANLAGAQLQKANLYWAQLQNAELDGAQLQEAQLHGAQLQKANLYGAQLQKANFRGAQLQNANLCKAQLQEANLYGAQLDNINLENAALSDGKHRTVLLADVRWGETNLALVDWTLVKMLGDEYQARQSKVVDDYRAAVRAYHQLSVILRNQGLNEDASRFDYRAQKLQKEVLRRQRKFGQYLFSLFLDLLAGYGHKPWRSFVTYLLVITAFATAYFIIGRTVGPVLSPLGSFVFSMTSFHGRGFFPGGIGLDDPLTVIAALEAFVGLLIEVTFIATLTQRLFGK